MGGVVGWCYVMGDSKARPSLDLSWAVHLTNISFVVSGVMCGLISAAWQWLCITK